MTLKDVQERLQIGYYAVDSKSRDDICFLLNRVVEEMAGRKKAEFKFDHQELLPNDVGLIWCNGCKKYLPKPDRPEHFWTPANWQAEVRREEGLR